MISNLNYKIHYFKQEMSMSKILLTCILALIFGISGVSQTTTVNPQLSIDTSIDDCIRLLENKENATLLKKYVAPDDLERILKQMSFDEFVDGFDTRKAENLLKAMKFAKGMRVDYNEDETICTIALSKTENFNKDLIFKKIDGLWYIADK